jgi:hypothetical protein
MVFVEVRSVVMLTTSKTSPTWMLAVLSYTTVTGGHMAAAEEIQLAQNLTMPISLSNEVLRRTLNCRKVLRCSHSSAMRPARCVVEGCGNCRHRTRFSIELSGERMAFGRIVAVR